LKMTIDVLQHCFQCVCYVNIKIFHCMNHAHCYHCMLVIVFPVLLPVLCMVL